MSPSDPILSWQDQEPIFKHKVFEIALGVTIPILIFVAFGTASSRGAFHPTTLLNFSIILGFMLFLPDWKKIEEKDGYPQLVFGPFMYFNYLWKSRLNQPPAQRLTLFCLSGDLTVRFAFTQTGLFCS